MSNIIMSNIVNKSAVNDTIIFLPTLPSRQSAVNDTTILPPGLERPVLRRQTNDGTYMPSLLRP